MQTSLIATGLSVRVIGPSPAPPRLPSPLTEAGAGAGLRALDSGRDADADAGVGVAPGAAAGGAFLSCPGSRIPSIATVFFGPTGSVGGAAVMRGRGVRDDDLRAAVAAEAASTACTFVAPYCSITSWRSFKKACVADKVSVPCSAMAANRVALLGATPRRMSLTPLSTSISVTDAPTSPPAADASKLGSTAKGRAASAPLLAKPCAASAETASMADDNSV